MHLRGNNYETCTDERGHSLVQRFIYNVLYSARVLKLAIVNLRIVLAPHTEHILWTTVRLTLAQSTRL